MLAGTVEDIENRAVDGPSAPTSTPPNASTNVKDFEIIPIPPEVPEIDLEEELPPLLSDDDGFYLTAETSMISYIIKNPHSLRSLDSYRECTPLLAKAEPQSAGKAKRVSDNTDNPVNISDETGNARDFTSKRVKESFEGVDEKIKDMVEKCKQRKNKMVRGFGPGKDISLPEWWVKDLVTEEANADADAWEKEHGSLDGVDELVKRVGKLSYDDDDLKEKVKRSVDTDGDFGDLRDKVGLLKL